ncbi:hypothetical protein SADUNF_Sadunf07G0041000 [Salix dunnii]|uniref:Glutamate receptor n=1 Tax=Salix dunnii TaxID=1413687 RepID=A0A835K321_9ROSI|nr:hypothetical protein SADUNF_Sadunf07G0041000 [Salix dunnii]
MDGFLALSYSILLLSVKFISSNAGQVNKEGGNVINTIGGVIDCNTRVGREEKIAMDIAVQDVYSSTGHNLTTHIQDLSGKSVRAASSAFHLSQNRKLLAIVGSLTWQQAALVSEMNEKDNELPVISLITAISPIIPEEKLPVISMYQDTSFEMNCISSIISYFKWTKVIALYEDRSSYSNDLGIITLLSNSLRVSGVELEHYSMFPAFSFLTDPNTTIQRELNILRSKQSRVFVLLQSSLTLTTLLFEKAKEMGMMGKGYVWITADGITSLLDSVDSSVVTSMQGVIGFKTYFSVTTAPFRKFEVKFRRKFRAEYPEEDSSRPSVFALRAYDAIQTIAKSAKMLQEKNYSKTLIQHILSSDFDGLSGRIQFKNYKLSEVPVFQIVNIVGKSYRELGFWSSKFGFTNSLIKHNSEENTSISTEEVLGPVYWPDGRTLVPHGLSETGIGEERRTQLRIAVPATSMFNQFVKVSHDENQNVTLITGFSINVFEAVVKCLQYPLLYDMVPFHGSYDDMVTAVSEKIYDAAVGDIVITANRHQLIEFSQPYVQSGLVTVVVMKSDKSHQSLMFLRPFTKKMWILMAAMTVYTGFVVWVIEHEKNEEFRGSPARQMGTILWFSFSTIVFSQRESLRSQWSRLLLLPWFFLILIVTSTYTANLTSMLQAPPSTPSEIDITLLRNTNAAIGYDGNSFTLWYLEKVLSFKAENIKRIASIDDFENSLSSGLIRAAFLFTPHAKILVAKYCKGLTMTGPTYNLSGFGFVFPRGSPLALNISEAIIYLTQNGELQKLEEETLPFPKCSTSTSDATGSQSLGPGPFSILFKIAFSGSTIALLVAVFRLLGKRWREVTLILSMLMDRGLWMWLAALFTQKKNNYELELSMQSSNPARRINST